MSTFFCCDDCRDEANRVQTISRNREMRARKHALKEINESFYAKSLAQHICSEAGKHRFRVWIREKCYTELTDEQIDKIIEGLCKK
jgi:hypothetical protein